MIKEAIYKLINHEDLTYEESLAVMGEMMDGTATQAQMGGFLTALRMQGETIDEITAFATVMREKGVKLHPERDVMEIVGTGGDEVGTFNISTTSAFVVAAAGIPVAKHGNRSISSRSGAADVLENLGAKMDLTAEQNETVLKKTDMCFMFAPVYHSSMRYAAPVRKELGVRTVFILRSSVQSGGRQNAASRCLRQRSCTGSGSGSFQSWCYPRRGCLRR